MRRRNWRTSLGGAIGIFGTSLIGVGVLTHMVSEDPMYKKLCFWTAFAGFLLTGAGKGMYAFFAADARDVESLKRSYDTDRFYRHSGD